MLVCKLPDRQKIALSKERGGEEKKGEEKREKECEKSGREAAREMRFKKVRKG